MHSLPLLFVAVIFCSSCLLLVSMQRDLSDLYDRMTGAALHQQTRIRFDEARNAADLFLILPFPVLPLLRERERRRASVCVCEKVSVRV